MSQLTRRNFLLGAAAAIPVMRSDAAWSAVVRHAWTDDDRIANIERRIGGHLGISAVDTRSGVRVDYRATERFAMCSTFKFLAVAAILKRVDDGRERLNRPIAYGKKDLLDYAPITKQHVDAGSMTVAELCAAAIDYSDNTAANLLLNVLGGPAGVTKYARSVNDRVTRLDRNEPSLNSALPGDDRDTTTPSAMLDDLKSILLGDVLSKESRQRLTNWLVGNKTGDARLRAGLPRTWRVGDKTGTGAHGAAGDIAIIWPTGRSPILIAMYVARNSVPAKDRDAAFEDVAKVVAKKFDPGTGRIGTR
jgi:beta-lactamase class A